VIASSWGYHGGAESRVSIRGNSVRFKKGPRDGSIFTAVGFVTR
jgi:hypothetical protein